MILRSPFKLNIDLFLFFAVLASSMIGAQIQGVSLPKIALIPLEIYLLVLLKNSSIVMNKEKWMLLGWFTLIVTSSYLNYCVTDSPLKGYKEVLLLNIIQTLIFQIPLLFLFSGVSDAFEKMKKYILVAAKISCIWCFVQFVAWYVFFFDFNHFFFIDLLRGVLGDREWTALYYDGQISSIRPTGFTHDPAFLSLLLVLGFVLTNSKYWKYLFFAGTLVAISRVGIISIVAIFFYQKYKAASLNLKIGNLVSGLCVSLVFIFATILLYNNNSFVENQIDKVVFRTVNMTNGKARDGSERHLYYVPAAVFTCIEMPAYNQILGTGSRTGGNALIITGAYKRFFEIIGNSQWNSWAIECDPAELLLGMGVSGLSLYYIIIFSFIRKYSKGNLQDKMLFLVIPFFGIMYNVSMHPLITLLLIVASQQPVMQVVNKPKKLSVIQRNLYSNDAKLAYGKRNCEESSLGKSLYYMDFATLNR